MVGIMVADTVLLGLIKDEIERGAYRKGVVEDIVIGSRENAGKPYPDYLSSEEREAIVAEQNKIDAATIREIVALFKNRGN